MGMFPKGCEDTVELKRLLLEGGEYRAWQMLWMHFSRSTFDKKKGNYGVYFSDRHFVRASH